MLSRFQFFVFYVLILIFFFRKSIISLYFSSNAIVVLEKLYNKYTDALVMLMDRMNSENTLEKDRLEKEIDRLRDDSSERKEKLEDEMEIENRAHREEIEKKIIAEHMLMCYKEATKRYSAESLDLDIEFLLFIFDKEEKIL